MQKKKMLRPTRIILFLFTLSLLVNAKSGDVFIGFDHYSIRNGLSNNYVSKVVQDSFGFLWIATNDGLNRYDGYEFRLYKHKNFDSLSIPDNVINDILYDSDGQLWVGTNSGLAVYSYERDNFSTIQAEPFTIDGLSSNNISCLYEDNNKNIWIGTKNAGLNCYIKKTHTFKVYKYSSVKGSIAEDNVHCVLQDNENNIWVGSHNKGISILPDGMAKFIYIAENEGLSNGTVLNMDIDERGRVYAGTSYLLNIIELQKNDSSDFSFKIENIVNPRVKNVSDNRIESMLLLNSKEVYIGYKNNGLYKFNSDDKSFVYYVNNNSVFDKSYYYSINSIYIDKTSNFWLGTYEKGLKKINPRKIIFGHYRDISTHDNYIDNNIVTNFSEDSQGRIWFSTSNSGIGFLDPVNNSIENYFVEVNNLQDRIYNAAFSIYCSKSDVYIGTLGGLMKVPCKTLANRKYLTADMKIDIPGFNNNVIVNDIIEDSLGNILFASRNGLLFYNPADNSMKRLTYKRGVPNSLSSRYSTCLLMDSDNQLWVGTENGLNLLKDDGETFNVFENFNDKSNNNFVTTLFQDSEGLIWIGTHGGGVTVFNKVNQTFLSMDETDGLGNGFVWGINEDNEGNIWLTTNMGLWKFEKKLKTFSAYSESDGLQSNEFFRNTFIKTSSGKFAIGGINGLNYFNPADVIKDTVPPKIVLTELIINNKRIFPGDKMNGQVILDNAIWLTSKLVLNRRNNSISLKFAGLQYNNPGLNTYMYKLENLDEKWVVPIGNVRTATYTDLRPGKYVFRLKSSNRDKVTQIKSRELVIIVKPFFYETFWFKILDLILILSLVFFFIRRRSARHQKREKELYDENSLLNSLLDNIPENVYLKDRNSKFIKVNKKKMEEMGLDDLNEAIGKSDFDYLSKEEALETYKDEQEIIKTGVPLVNKTETRIRGGEKRFILTSKIPIFNNNNKIEGIVGISRDITEQIEADKKMELSRKMADETDKMKSSFLANMSHEIRTPMNSIIGFSDLLAEKNLTEKEKKVYISFIHSNGDKLLQLIDEILDISRMEANQFKLHITEFYLNPLLEKIYNNVLHKREILGKDHLLITTEFGTQEDNFSLVCDEARLHQIINTMFTNAMNFTQKGSIHFSYEIRDNEIEFKVRDTGLGIEKDKIKLIFEPFSHFEQRFKVNVAGTGLGLAVSKRIIEMMGGRIWIESISGAGTTVSFTIPRNIKREDKE